MDEKEPLMNAMFVDKYGRVPQRGDKYEMDCGRIVYEYDGSAWVLTTPFERFAL